MDSTVFTVILLLHLFFNNNSFGFFSRNLLFCKYRIIKIIKKVNNVALKPQQQ